MESQNNHHTTTNLIHGSNIISSRLRFNLSPMSLLFKFNQVPPYRPKPLSVTTVFLILSTFVAALVFDYLLFQTMYATAKMSNRIQLIIESRFILTLLKIARFYRISFIVAVLSITVAQHSSIASVMANNNNYATLKNQEHSANASSNVFLFKSLVTAIMLISIIAGIDINLNNYHYYLIPIMVILTVLNNMTLLAPVAFTCYLGSSLGKHVENFSALYIDTMFDQFLKAASIGGENNHHFLSIQNKTEGVDDIQEENKHLSSENKSLLSRLCCCFSWFSIVGKSLVRFYQSVIRKVREVSLLLNSTEYPELPEMKMTKLSSIANIKISEQARNSNNQLLRNRLRKTQVMLSELRDMVSDINKMSSPIILMLIISETILMILISTISVQGRFFKSISPLIIPAIINIVGLTIVVVHVCTCLDDTIGQLKLMMNKLFDFIIMNHRVQTVSADEALQAATMLGPSKLKENYRSSAATEKENMALSETWSQFQYTRKLANSIQFTMGGIIPVTRRLVLLILGHILSAVFVSIEIMSIIDTSDSSHEKGTIDLTKVVKSH